MAEFNAIALFCDNIKEEKSGTHNLIGVLGDSMVVPGVPGTLAKIAIYVRIHLPLDFEAMQLDTFLAAPNGREILINTIEKSLVSKSIREARDSGHSIAGIFSNLVASPFAVPQAGQYVVTLKGKFGSKVLAALNIVDQKAAPTSPIASQPPS